LESIICLLAELESVVKKDVYRLVWPTNAVEIEPLLREHGVKRPFILNVGARRGRRWPSTSVV
jgi:hypothetical protein